MRFKPGIRSYFIITFVVIFGLSIYLVNNYFLAQQEQIKTSFDNIDSKSILTNLKLETSQDSLYARELMNSINSIKALTTTTLIEVKSYSWMVIAAITLMAFGFFIFLIMKFSKPIIELQKATELIKKGFYEVSLPVTGIRELRELKSSFNTMSQELIKTQEKLIDAEKEAIWKD